MSFQTPLLVEQVSDTEELWVLRGDLVFASDMLSEVVTVPAGFVTDFASVPRLPLVYWLMGNVARRPAVVHDFLYSSGRYEREVADKVLLEAMHAIEMGGWRKYPIFAAVRLFGGSHYERKSNATGN